MIRVAEETAIRADGWLTTEGTVGGPWMRAIEDLLNDVRDAGSREHLGEAVRAYQAGAFRSSIISTWIAVALDLVAKVRELADMGEPGASAYIADLDRAIAKDDARKLMELERGLLDKARDDFELIAPREHDELKRLLDDRHVCAHPAFVNPDVVFSPTPELCRSHLAVAVDAVLKHGPTPGRKALDRFMVEVQGSSWPSGRRAVEDYLRARYVERGKETLRRNLAVVVIKGCLDPPGGNEVVARRLSEVAHVLEILAPALLDAALADVLTRREETTGLSDEQLLRMLGALGDLEATWRAFPASSHPRVIAAVTNASNQQLVRTGALASPPGEAAIASAVDHRLAHLERSELAEVIDVKSGRLLVGHALRHLRDAGSWRGGEECMRTLVLPLARHFQLEDLCVVHEVLRENDQVRLASGMPPMIEDLFAETVDIPGALNAWQEISDWLLAQGRDGDPSDWYAYPELARQVAAARVRGARS
jgi:hypothetical protein